VGPQLWRAARSAPGDETKLFLSVTDAAGRPIRGAYATLGAHANVDVKHAELLADESGVIHVPATVRTSLKTSVSAPGYEDVTLDLAVPHENRIVDIVLTERHAPTSVKGGTLAPYVEEVRSGPLPSGIGRSFSAWYELPAPKPKAGYRIDPKGIEYSLSGDRKCNAWSECQIKQSPTGEVTLMFRLQGHDEWVPLRPAYSEGVLRVRYLAGDDQRAEESKKQ